MESMDAEAYALEYMIRDRLRNAQARARVAALLAEAKPSQGPNAIETRFTDLGRHLVNGVRRVVSELFHTLPGRMPRVKEDAR
jgi:hypothetical protein